MSEFLTLLEPSLLDRKKSSALPSEPVPILGAAEFHTEGASGLPYTLIRTRCVKHLAKGFRVLFRNQRYVVVAITVGTRAREVELRCETLEDYISNSVVRLRHAVLRTQVGG